MVRTELYYGGNEIGDFVERNKSKAKLIVLFVPRNALLENVFRESNTTTFCVYRLGTGNAVFIRGSK